MTRKDYVKFAAMLKHDADYWQNPETANLARYVQTYRIAKKVADIFAEDNERFDRAKFMAASGF